MSQQPNIILSSLDLDRLETLLDKVSDDTVPGAQALEAELDRADVVLEPTDIPDTVVTMNSTVRFSTADADKDFELTLVYPKDVDGSPGKISILAPVGSALLGLSVGDALEWPKPGGATTQVRVEEILYQPEKAGELHR